MERDEPFAHAQATPSRFSGTITALPENNNENGRRSRHRYAAARSIYSSKCTKA